MHTTPPGPPGLGPARHENRPPGIRSIAMVASAMLHARLAVPTLSYGVPKWVYT